MPREGGSSTAVVAHRELIRGTPSREEPSGEGFSAKATQLGADNRSAESECCFGKQSVLHEPAQSAKPPSLEAGVNADDAQERSIAQCSGGNNRIFRNSQFGENLQFSIYHI